MDINWDALSAAGTWLGAIATSSAVYVALRESRKATSMRVDSVARCCNPRCSMSDCNNSPDACNSFIEIKIINTGYKRALIKKVVVKRYGYSSVSFPINCTHPQNGDYAIVDIDGEIDVEFKITRIVEGKERRRSMVDRIKKSLGFPYSVYLVDIFGDKHRVNLNRETQEKLLAVQETLENI